MPKKLLLIGGYGKAGSLLAELLLKFSDASIIIGGKDITKAQDLVKHLNEKNSTDRMSYINVDPSDYESLKKSFQNTDMVVVASGRLQFVEKIISASLETNLDYFDLRMTSSKKLQTLRAFAENIRSKNLCFITDGGYYPGLPSAIARYAASFYDDMRSAKIGCLIHPDWKSYSLSEANLLKMIDEIAVSHYWKIEDGRWTKSSLDRYRQFTFNHKFQDIRCIGHTLEELNELYSLIPSLKELSFFVSGINPVSEYIIKPAVKFSTKILPNCNRKLLAKMLAWSWLTFNSAPYLIKLIIDTTGKKDGIEFRKIISVEHEDGYLISAAPAAACLLQYLDLSIKKPGLHFQGNIVEPERFFNDLKKMGLKVDTNRLSNITAEF